MLKHGHVITIDGPAGAGKSTVAKMLSQRLGYQYLDTGAIYRCIALLARESAILPMNFSQNSQADADLRAGLLDAKLKSLLEGLGATFLRFEWQGPTHCVFVNGRDVTQAIRQEANSQAASSISARPVVRDALLQMQRDLGAEGGVVIEGRDTGTVVFPKANLKIYLTANLDIRAERRLKDLVSRGEPASLAGTRSAIAERDRQDASREVAPLKAADDAREVDTSGLTIEEVVQVLFEVAQTLGQ